MSLGARLKELRISKKQSLQDVAGAVGASKAHIWEIERGGSKNPSMDLLTGLAKHFGVSVAYLVGEQPNQDEAELVAMYRDLKHLDEADRETIKMLVQRMREKKGEG
jgi:transcriptional regulator with XRE-family HTH domain